jgi:Ca2+/Na+ antiporter
MAVSNAIGSNVFDICIGLGLPWFVETGKAMRVCCMNVCVCCVCFA